VCHTTADLSDEPQSSPRATPPARHDAPAVRLCPPRPRTRGPRRRDSPVAV